MKLLKRNWKTGRFSFKEEAKKNATNRKKKEKKAKEEQNEKKRRAPRKRQKERRTGTKRKRRAWKKRLRAKCAQKLKHRTSIENNQVTENVLAQAAYHNVADQEQRSTTHRVGLVPKCHCTSEGNKLNSSDDRWTGKTSCSCPTSAATTRVCLTASTRGYREADKWARAAGATAIQRTSTTLV